MTGYVFLDNTVLCNFAAVHRLDLLESILRGRGRWTEAVAYEASRSAAYLPDLDIDQMYAWLLNPIEIDGEEVRRVEHLRRAVFGGTDEKPLQHLGEAQTCYLLKESGVWAGSWWASDDRDAVSFAQWNGIVTRSTVQLLEEAVATYDISEPQIRDFISQLAKVGR